LSFKGFKQLDSFPFLAALRQAKISSASTNSDNTIFWFLQQKPRRLRALAAARVVGKACGFIKGPWLRSVMAAQGVAIYAAPSQRLSSVPDA
jgi:hypothetical protein